MNINMLADEDNDSGFYAAACGLEADRWRGAVLWVSTDGGASYTAVDSLTAPATMGYTTNALGTFSGGNIPDELNSVNVTMSHGSLSSTTYAGLLAGTNTAIIGDEIVYFRDATLEADETYTIRGLLRGRRGSEYAMSSHAIDDRFVLVDPDWVHRIVRPTSDIGIEKIYKAVSVGSTIALATEYPFTNLGARLKPYAPVEVGGGRNAAGDVTINWTRRNRISAEWRDSVDVPMSETTESYTVEIWNSARTTLKRTIGGLTSPTTTYSAADQTTDFGSPQATVYVSVYQLSSIVGRGYEARGTI